jgi:nitrate reductase gamma subunit
MPARALKEIHMYIGGGLLGAILVIALIVFLLRRA